MGGQQQWNTDWSAGPSKGKGKGKDKGKDKGKGKGKDKGKGSFGGGMSSVAFGDGGGNFDAYQGYSNAGDRRRALAEATAALGQAIVPSGELKGYVSRFNHEKRFGFIRRDDRE